MAQDSRLMTWSKAFIVIVGGILALNWFAMPLVVGVGQVAVSSQAIGLLIVLAAVYWLIRAIDQNDGIDENEIISLALLAVGIFLLGKGFPFATYDLLGLKMSFTPTIDITQTITIASGVIVGLVGWSAVKRKFG